MRKVKIQLAYKVSGERREEVVETLKGLCAVLEKAGHETYCPILDPNSNGINGTLRHLDESNVLLLYVKSEDKSEGMLLEAGYAKGRGKRLILAIKRGLDYKHTRAIADVILEYENLKDLGIKLRTLK